MTTQATVDIEDAVLPAEPIISPVKKQVIQSPADKKRILETAENALLDSGMSLEDIPFLIAAEKINAANRKPKLASLHNVRKSPICVVMLEWHKDESSELDKPWDRDCQGFDDLDLAKDYWDVNHEFAQMDVKEYGDTTHLVVLFPDTKDFSERKHIVVSKGMPKLPSLIEAALVSNDIDFMFGGKVRPSNEGPKAKPVVPTKAKVTGTKKISDAAKKLKASVEASHAKADDLTARMKANKAKQAAEKAAKALPKEAVSAQEAFASIEGVITSEVPALIMKKPAKKIIAKTAPKADTAAAFIGKARPAKKVAAKAS